MSAGKWRLVMADGTVRSHDVELIADRFGEWWFVCLAPDRRRATDARSPLDALIEVARADRWPVVEFVAPGAETHAEEVTRLTEALRFLCRADVGPCDFCGATATKRDPADPLTWWCDVCAPPDAVDHEHAATLRPLLPPRGKPQWGER